MKNIRLHIKKQLNEMRDYPLSHMDDYGNLSQKINGFKKYVNSTNNNLISESSLNRILSYKDKEWAIITAYRGMFTKEENIKRNRILRGILNDYKIGVHQLVGHWRECSISGMEYDECPSDKLVDVVERSYFVVKPDDMDSDDFHDLMVSLMTIQDETQDAIVYHVPWTDEIYVIGPDGSVYSKFREWGLNKISQAYSQYVKKLNVPFIFEGMEIPGSNSGRMVMKNLNIQYI